MCSALLLLYRIVARTTFARSAAGAGAMSLVEELASLAKLHSDGALSDQEFNDAKKLLISGRSQGRIE